MVALTYGNQSIEMGVEDKIGILQFHSALAHFISYVIPPAYPFQRKNGGSCFPCV